MRSSFVGLTAPVLVLMWAAGAASGVTISGSMFNLPGPPTNPANRFDPGALLNGESIAFTARVLDATTGRELGNDSGTSSDGTYSLRVSGTGNLFVRLTFVRGGFETRDELIVVTGDTTHNVTVPLAQRRPVGCFCPPRCFAMTRLHHCWLLRRR
jgi:hypothetical protein